MAQIPYNPVATVGAEAGATPFDQTRPSAADFGAAIGEGLQQAGKQTSVIAQQEQEQALTLQRQRNATWFNEADTKMSDEVSALTTEFQSVRGSNAADKLPEFQKRLDQVRDKYQKMMNVPQLERAFSERWGNYQNTANRVFGSHAAQQVEESFVKSLESKSAAAVDRLIRNSGFGGTAPEYDEIIDSAVELAHHLGWDKPTTDQYVQRQASEAVQGIVQARMDSGNFEQARSIFDSARKADVPGTDVPMLDGQTAARLNHSITSEMKSREALQRAELSQEAVDLARSSIAARMQTGQMMSPQDEAAIKAGMTPKQWDAYQSKLSLADKVYSVAGNLGQKSDTEIMGMVEELNPSRGKTAGQFADSDYGEKSEVYKMAKEMSKTALAQRRSDPATAVIQNFTPVQYAMHGWEQNPQDPGHAQSFIKKSLAAQTSLGIPESSQMPLPKWKADQISAQIANPNPQAAGEAIKTYEKQFGKYWNSVFSQISPKMDPATLVAATMDDDTARTILIDASRKPRPDLIKLTGIKETDLTTYVVSDPRFQDFQKSMAPYGLGNSNITAMRNSIETLALGYMASMSQDSATAIDNATKQVMGKYQFGNVNNQAFAAPKEVDLSAVETAAYNVLSKINTDGFDLPAGRPGQTEADIRNLYQTDLKNKGRWVTNKGMTGLQLWSGRGPVTRYGRPVTYTWEQLLAAGNEPAESDTPKVLTSTIPGVN